MIYAFHLDIDHQFWNLSYGAEIWCYEKRTVRCNDIENQAVSFHLHDFSILEQDD